MKGDGKKFLGSFMANAKELENMNGTTDMMGMPSQGAQELAQKVEYDENFIKTIPGGFNNMQEIERRRKIFEGMP